jgi:superfamily I DNA/RNA helicase
MLSTDTESKDDANNTPVGGSASATSSSEILTLLASQQKVTITTVHGAKGLEWPVVFLPCRQYSNGYRSNIVSG